MASGKFEISLQGEASLFLPAERAVLGINVSARGQDKEFVSKDTVSTAKKVGTLLWKLSPQSISPEAKSNAAVDKWSRTSLSENSHVPYDHKNEKYLSREYSATVEFEVQFQHFQAISGLIHDLSTLSHVKTGAVEWILLEVTKERNQSALRMEAAENAKMKAREYAVALGYRKVEPFLLKEGRMFAERSPMKGARIPSSEDDVKNSNKNMAEVGAEDWEEVDDARFEYEPEDVEMSATVSASFYATGTV